MSETITEYVATARDNPDDVMAQIRAAYACDRDGQEYRAAEFYDAAWRLGVPEAARSEFIIGYGSTLRNVGRTEEALAILSAFLREHPHDPAARCFYALALYSAGQPACAVSEMLAVALSLHEASPRLTRYQRALMEYREELRSETAPPRTSKSSALD